MSAPSAESARTSSSWWGTFRIATGTAGCWRVGPMTLWIQHLRNEWRIATTAETHDDGHASVEVPCQAGDLLALDQVSRFGVSTESEHVTVTPLLADKPVITSPEKPLYIPPGESVTVYVGSPLWVRLDVGAPPITLTEFPVVRPSDTWFGSDTQRGELCYSSRTACRLQLEEFQVRPYRAVTAVRVKNRAPTPLLFDRMKLPVAYLPLFYSDGGAFWTRDLTITHVEGQEEASVRYGAEVPSHPTKADLVSPARQKAGDNLAVRVFSSLLSRI